MSKGPGCIGKLGKQPHAVAGTLKSPKRQLKTGTFTIPQPDIVQRQPPFSPTFTVVSVLLSPKLHWCTSAPDSQQMLIWRVRRVCTTL